MKKLSALLLFALAAPLTSFAQWQADTNQNAPVCTAQLKQIDPQSATDGRGGVITCWQDNRAGNGLFGAVYAQRLDYKGVREWDTNGILVSSNLLKAERPKIIADGKGGAFVAWIDYRYQASPGPSSGESDVFAQHLDSTGTVLWQAGGVVIDSNGNGKDHITLALDDSGGVYVAWDEFVNANNSNAIIAQRLNSSGHAVWSNALSVANVSGSQYAYEPQIVADGHGGFYAAWYDNRWSHTDIIYAQRVRANGTKMWSTSDVQVSNGNKDQKYSQLVANGNNGVIITWQDDRANTGGFTPGMDIYAQALDTSGRQLWLRSGDVVGYAKGIPVCTATQLQLFPRIVSDQNGGAYISWTDRRNGVGNEAIYLQHLNSNGDTLLPANGILISNDLIGNGSSVFVEDYSLPSLHFDKDSGLTVAWIGGYQSGYPVRAQRLDSAGSFLWNPAGKTISSATGIKMKVQLVGADSSDVIFVWQDTRAADTVSSNDDIYATIYPVPATDTTTGVASVNQLTPMVYPNPVHTILNIDLGSGNVSQASLQMINNIGAVVLKKQQVSGKRFQVSMETLPPGIYYLELTLGHEVYTRKIIRN